MESFIITLMVMIIIGGPLLYFAKYDDADDNAALTAKASLNSDTQKENIKQLDIKLAEDIYSRYVKAKQNSLLMLKLAITSLVTGGIFFYYAADLGWKDRQRTEELAKSKIRADLNDAYLDLHARSKRINLDSLRKEKYYEDLNDTSGKKVATNSLAHLEKESYVLNRLEIMKKSDEQYSVEKKSQNNNLDSLYILVTTISLRIIISLLTFYLAQLFLKLYNYYLQVSDFYVNRYDAILAFDEDKFKIDFKEMTAIFEHKKEVGIGPKSPIDTAIGIVNAFKK